MINYLRKLIHYQRARHRRKVLIKVKKSKTKDLKINNQKKEPQNNCIVEESKENSYPNEAFFEQAESNFMPPKREFFLYTINEHEVLTNKIFTAKKKLSNNLTSTSKLSKSDTNLSISKDCHLF